MTDSDFIDADWRDFDELDEFEGEFDVEHCLFDGDRCPSCQKKMLETHITKSGLCISCADEEEMTYHG